MYQLCTAGYKQLYLWKGDTQKGGALTPELVNIGATYRDYRCVEFSKGGEEYLYAGTTSGDFIVV